MSRDARCWSGSSRAEKDAVREVVATEMDFDLPFAEGLRFRGTLDRLDKLADGGYEIVEYKTQRRRAGRRAIGGDLQMTLYALGMRPS